MRAGSTEGNMRKLREALGSLDSLVVAFSGGVDSAVLLVPGLGYFAIALTTDINLGYRHILPSLPFSVTLSKL